MMGMDIFGPLMQAGNRFGFGMSCIHLEKFLRYHTEILRWSSRVHLVSSGDLSRIPSRHFLDSLLPLHLNCMPDLCRVVDIGSGAGFPGIPLAICRPEMHITLVESNRKKGLFLQHIVRTLCLSNVIVRMDRMEHLGKQEDLQATYDVAVARAVTSLGKLVPWGFPLLKPGGQLIVYKGLNLDQELVDTTKVLGQWDGRINVIHRISIPELPVSSSIVVLAKKGGGIGMGRFYRFRTSFILHIAPG